MSSPRQAVRVVLIDPDDRLLLLWHSRPQDDDHWAPPGGGLEPGEDLLAAAARELQEEVGVTGLALRRPVWTWQHRFSYFGTSILQHETIYAVRLDTALEPGGAADAPDPDGIACARWWSVAELATCTDDVWPHGLAALTPQLLGGDLDPDQPRRLLGG